MASEQNEYEAQREARIVQNRRRMEELGLVKLAKDLSVSCNRPRQERQPRSDRTARTLPDPSLPRRRSDRNTGNPAPSYNERALDLVDSRERSVRLREHIAGQDEVYSAEDIKKLGSHKEKWELFVDGYDEEGNRIYDKVNGETCHQCRQKTVCKHTACSSCKELRGVFCGDCLFMRYGENLDEVMVPGNTWVCPVCRDLCNCSNHRHRRGWAPTGSMYRNAIGQGFLSVAHYLVLTHQAPAEQPATAVADSAVVVKESEPEQIPPAAAAAEVPAAVPPPAAKTPLAASSLPNLPSNKLTLGKAIRSGKAMQTPIDVLLTTAAKAGRPLRSGKGKASAGLSEARGLGVAVKGVQKPLGLPKRVTRATAGMTVA